MKLNRRAFAGTALAAAACGLEKPSFADESDSRADGAATSPRIPIAVSTYSFWRFKDDSKLPIERCIDESARMGFDAVEILHMQMEAEDNVTCRNSNSGPFSTA
jgi:hypothetical protein